MSKRIMDYQKNHFYSIALRLIAQRNYYSKYLEYLLQKKGASASTAKSIVQKLLNDSYINDDTYLQTVVLYAIKQKQSPQYIVAKLLKKHVPYQQAKSVVDVLYTKQIQKNVMRKIAISKKKSLQELKDYFFRKGFLSAVEEISEQDEFSLSSQ